MRVRFPVVIATRIRPVGILEVFALHAGARE